MKFRIVFEIELLAEKLSLLHECRKKDEERQKEEIIANRKAKNPDYQESNIGIVTMAELLELTDSEECQKIEEDIYKFLKGIGEDIIILETLKDIGKDFLVYRDFSMNYTDTLYHWLNQNLHYRPKDTVEYFCNKMNFDYIGYLYFGYAAAFNQLDIIEKEFKEARMRHENNRS